MTGERRDFMLAAMMAALAILASRSSSQGTSTRQTQEFSQRKAQANMQELEDRMFQLANLVRETEPDHAARLVLGLRRSREDVIVAEMGDIRALITAGKTEEAIERQRIVLVKLEELRRLLLSADLDLILKLERLRQLTRLGKALAEVRKEEEREAGVLEKLADEDLEAEERRRRLESLREAAEETKRRLDDASAEAREAMPSESGVARELEAARREQDAAAKELEEGKEKAAAKRKRALGGGIAASSDKVRSAREALLEELQDAIRAAVIDALNQMVQLQEKVHAGLPPAGVDLSGMRFDKLRDFERGVIDLCRNTRDLVEETEFSVALPFALRVEETMASSCAVAFAGATIDGEARRLEGRLLGDLRALLKILMDEAAGAQRAGRPSAGGCKGCADRNKLISELSIVRLLEAGIEEETKAMDSRRSSRAPEATAAQEAREALRAVAGWQAKTREVTDALKGRSCSKCLGDPK